MSHSREKDSDSSRISSAALSGLIRQIEALYALVPPHARYSLMASLKMQPHVPGPYIDLFGKVPASAKLEDVADWMNGVNAFYLAMGSLKPSATISELKKAAAAIVSSQPYLGDPHGEVNDVPLSTVMMATGNKELAVNLDHPAVVELAVAQAASYLGASDLPFTGKISAGGVANAFGLTPFLQKLTAQAEEARSEGGVLVGKKARPHMDQTSSISGSQPVLSGSPDRPMVTVPPVPSVPAITTPERQAEIISNQPPATSADIARLAMTASAASAPEVQMDIARMATAMDEVIARSLSQMSELTKSIDSNKSALDKIAVSQTKLNWMKAVASMPDDLAANLRNVVPDFSSAPNAIATVSGVISSIPDSSITRKAASIWKNFSLPFKGDIRVAPNGVIEVFDPQMAEPAGYASDSTIFNPL